MGVRNDVIDEVTVTRSDGQRLLDRIEGELLQVRYAKTAYDIWDADLSPFFEPSDDPEVD